MNLTDSFCRRNRKWILLPLSLCLILGALGVYYLFQRSKPMMSMLTIVLTLVLTVSYGVGPVVSKKNENKSAKPFCLKVQRYIPPGDKLKWLNSLKSSDWEN
jgi:hypothetical protein